jgi:hypothetical protein
MAERLLRALVEDRKELIFDNNQKIHRQGSDSPHKLSK